MRYESLLGQRSQLVQIATQPKKSAKVKAERGCEHCPADKTKGINKVFEKINPDKKLCIVGMAPGREENAEEKNFVGRSGQFLWKELDKVGIQRSDVNTMNVVRCFPVDRVDGYMVMRDPSKEELHCCSIYTEKSVAKSNAKVYVVLGEKAQRQFLGKEYKKTRKIFWSENLKAKVYCLHHPSYFVRGVFPQVHLDDLRKGLEAIAHDLGSKGSHSRFSYLEEQDYRCRKTVADAHKAAAYIRKVAYKGVRASVDIEDDTLDGKKTDLCVGFSVKSGTADVFITGHPLARKVNGKWRPLKKSVQRKIRAIVGRLLADKNIKKVLQHGSYDGKNIKEELDVPLRGYDFDTNYSEYLAYPDRRSYGLAAIAAARFPRFGEYKTIAVPYILPKDVSLAEHKIEPTDYSKMLELTKKVGVRYSQLPLKKLVLYNGADCDITKRIELTTKKKVNLPLLRVYKDAAFILDRMEPNGPAFDFEHYKKLKKLYPVRLAYVYDKIKQIAGRTFKGVQEKKVKGKIVQVEKVFWDNSDPKTEFNPGSPQQVQALLFQKLKLEYPLPLVDNRGRTVKPSTGKNIMELLSRKYEIARLQTEYRKLSKIESTYLDSYRACAKANDGLLRTRWNLTGTRTGRLSSGGGKATDDEGFQTVINLQNVHGDTNLKNQLVADPNWRKLYAAIFEAVKKSIGTSYLDKIKDVQGRLARIPQYSAKAREKKKEIEAELYDKEKGLIPRFRAKLSNSLKFKKLTKKILAGALGATLVLLGFDQGQVEVRVMAQASGDENLIRDCMSGDIHSQVGHAMTGWSIEDIKKDKKTRTLTKNCIAKGQLVLTDKGLVPIEDVTVAMKVWDGVSFVSHDGVISKGLKSVISYDGLTATPDHNVWDAKGNKRRFEDAKKEGYGLLATGDKENPIRYEEACLRSIFKRQRQMCEVEVLRMSSKLRSSSGNDLAWNVDKLQVPKRLEIPRRSSESISTSILRSTTTLRESKIPELGELRRTGDKEQVQKPSTVCEVYVERMSSSDVSGSGDRSYRQRWPLREGQSSVSLEEKECTEYTQECLDNVQRSRISSKQVSEEIERGLSELHSSDVCDSSQAAFGGILGVFDKEEGTRKVSEVYDIVNAGPHHRFTVSDRLVSNCHFGILFGMSANSLYNFLKVKDPDTDVTPERAVELYNNYFKAYPGVRRFIEKMRAFVEEHGYVETMFGFRRQLGNSNQQSEIGDLMEESEEGGGAYWANMAVNTPIQGAAHCLMLMAFAIMKRKWKEYKDMVPTLEIHDYIGFKVRLRDIIASFDKGRNLLEKEPLKLIKREYPEIKWKIPLSVEGVVGMRFGDSIEADGKTMPQLLCDMFLETYQKECRLDADLEMIA